MSGQPIKFAHTRVEYGVIVNRTSRGLGYYLAQATESFPTAEMTVEALGDEFPVEIKKRIVAYTDWEGLPPDCTSCDDTGRVPWMSEADPNLYQEPDGDGTLPCPDCSAGERR